MLALRRSFRGISDKMGELDLILTHDNAAHERAHDFSPHLRRHLRPTLLDQCGFQWMLILIWRMFCLQPRKLSFDDPELPLNRPALIFEGAVKFFEPLDGNPIVHVKALRLRDFFLDVSRLVLGALEKLPFGCEFRGNRNNVGYSFRPGSEIIRDLIQKRVFKIANRNSISTFRADIFGR